MDSLWIQGLVIGGAALLVAVWVFGFRSGRFRERANSRTLISAAQRLLVGGTLDGLNCPAGAETDWNNLLQTGEEGRRLREDDHLAATEQRQEGHAQALRALSADLSGRLAEALAPIPALLSRAEKLGEAAESVEILRLIGDLRQSLEPLNRILTHLRAIDPRGGGTPSPQPLEGLADLALASARLQAEAKGVSLEFAPPDRTLPVLVDPAAVVTAFEALIDNAIKAAAPQHGRVWVWAESGPATATLIIEDNGPGIPEAVANAVFDPLFSTRPETGGTGLGLPLALAVARRHGGDLRLEPRPGGGTVARLILPAAPSSSTGTP